MMPVQEMSEQLAGLSVIEDSQSSFNKEKSKSIQQADDDVSLPDLLHQTDTDRVIESKHNTTSAAAQAKMYQKGS